VNIGKEFPIITVEPLAEPAQEPVQVPEPEPVKIPEPEKVPA